MEAHISNSTRVADADSPRLTELRLLPKDPPKGRTKNLSATGSNSVIEIMLSYGLQTKHNNCALTKEEIIVSFLRHEASLEYRGNLDHDAWRSSRGAELIMLPLEGKQLSLRAMVSDYHLRLTHAGGLSKEQAIAGILCYECPETIRQACFQTFCQDHQRVPTSYCQCQVEIAYVAYLDCSLHRRYASYRGKPALRDDEIRNWEFVFRHVLDFKPRGKIILSFKPLLTSSRKTITCRSCTGQSAMSRPTKADLPACSALLCVLAMAMCISTIVMARLPSSDLV